MHGKMGEKKNSVQGHQDKIYFTPTFESQEVLTHKDKDNAIHLKEFKTTTDQICDYDPYDFKTVSHPTTNVETLLHMLKGSLGIGILAMPMAFLHSGWLLGIIATAIIGVISTYCIHLLLNAEYTLCKRQKVPNLTYPLTAKFALMDGPPVFQKLAHFAGLTVNVFLLVNQLGACCAYTVFIAANIKAVCDAYFTELDERIYMLIFLLPLILVNSLRNLKYLAPVMTVANVMTFASFGIILYYLIIEDMDLSQRKAVGKVADFPLYFGTVLFALEVVGVIMPIKNEMKTPKYFGGWCGVLNISMSTVVTIFILLGFFGYLAYGDRTLGSITLNIGQNYEDEKMRIPADAAKVMLSLAIFFTHALQMYVALDITWTQYLAAKFQNSSFQTYYEYVVRVCMVLLTFTLAVAIPELDLFISLFGSLCLSSLGITFPAIIDLCINWDGLHGTKGKILIGKNIFLIIFAVFGLIIGTYTSIDKIIERFTE
ncbi:proton-coupled amino acid transporter-like protein CG1139 [Aethina tumida]|uniref:proton-coupled amino acid transporter-like protein CG1139 n=1 Tax=Aethina tumida TaxID=116153 RepID=UPI00214937F7|nr:proton-coupled amino acid transporter-like protein CG1139 [Aethina tumida]